MKQKCPRKLRDERPEAMKTIEDTYPYQDEEGDSLYEQVRFADKSFAFRRPAESGGWLWNMDGVRRVLYHLPEVIAANEVFIVEGEKDVESLRKWGLVATCNPGGAGKWSDEYSKSLKGKKVIVLQDDDKAGRKRALHVAQSVLRYAKEVRLVKPFVNAKDVSEWIEKGRTKKKLLKMVAATPIYDSSAEAPLVVESVPEAATPAVPILQGSKLVRKLELFFKKRVILPSGLTLVIALWAIGTYLSDAFDCFPYLCITSPTKRCGKTLLAELIGLVSARTKSTVNISEAALFRMIQVFHPTIIMDEAETLANRKSERAQFLLSLLNAGHRRGANVIRCVGPDHTPTEFPVYCPKVLLAIGNLPDTFRDRSIIVSMRRRRKDEHVARYRYREVSQKGSRRAALAQAWADAHTEKVAAEYAGQDLEFLNDREADNWAPIFAVAAVGIPDRLEELRRIAVRLGNAKNTLDVDDSDSLRLLSDVRQILVENNLKRIGTGQLITRLQQIEESPWGEITQFKLARTLRSFGVSSKQLWIGERNIKGYEHSDLKPVFDSYLSG
jgi:5S rRNA maturation endonuclease (ribonuclease M5)